MPAIRWEEAGVAAESTDAGPDEGNPVQLARPRLRLLDSFELTLEGRVVEVPLSSQRLIALLALQDRVMQRSAAAGTLWPESCEQRALGNLRSALWRVHRSCPGLILAVGGRIVIADRVDVDVRKTISLARRLLGDVLIVADLRTDPTALDGELLPDWYDDWLDGHRDRLRLLELHALEVLSEHLSRSGRWAEAVDAALLAVIREPMRETARRALILAHLAEGNRHEALREFTAFRRLLTDELGVEPSEQLRALLALPAGEKRLALAALAVG